MKSSISATLMLKSVKITAILSFCILLSFQLAAQHYYPAGLGNTNLKLWLTAADGSSVLNAAGTPATNGSQVARWKDKSGMGADAVQATTTAQPVYNTNVKNGNGALVFQNTNQYFTGASGTYRTIVSARAITGSGSNNYHYLFSAPANTDFSIRNAGGGPGSNAVAYTDGPNVNDWCYNTGSPSTQWINGTQGLVGSSSNHILVDASANPVTATYSISSTFMSRGMYGNDPLYELLAYSTTLNTTQRVLLENYEAAVWGMAATLPSSGYTIFTPASATSYNKNLVGIGYTSSTDNFLANPAGGTDGLGFSSTTTAAGFLNTAGYLMAAHNGQSNTITPNASIPGISGSNISLWNRSWKLQKNGGNSSGQVTLNFNFSDYNGTTPTTTASYALLYNATDGSFATGTNKLIRTAALTTVSGNNVAFVISAANLLNGYYTIVYSTTSLLPVHFTAFTASTATGNVQLQWSVADQTGTESYQVERSADGIHFANIKTLTGNGAGAANAYYTFTDNISPAGTLYYRILLTDATGSMIYSATKLVNTVNNFQPAISVYPNPTTDYIHIDLHTSGLKKASIQVLNTGGQAVIANTTLPASGVLDMPVQQLSKGMYILQINVDGVISTVKLVKN